MMDYLSEVGLVLNFAGTLLVIFFIGKDPNEWVEGEDNQKPGEKRYALLVYHPKWLGFGVCLIAIGFLLQLFEALIMG